MCEQCVDDCPGCAAERGLKGRKLRRHPASNDGAPHLMRKSPELFAWVNEERAKLGLPPLPEGGP